MENTLYYYHHLPFWHLLNSSEQEVIKNNSYIKTVKQYTYLHGNGNKSPGYLYILLGALRAFISSDECRELNLFCINKGESCIVSMFKNVYNINIETKIDSELIIIPQNIIDNLVALNFNLMVFIHDLFSQRLQSVISVINQVAFTRLDKRIAKLLISLKDNNTDNTVYIRQQEIASKVNSVRVSVSRILKHFENDGIIECHRGSITIKHYEQLKILAK